jgi:hypothetical protein
MYFVLVQACRGPAEDQQTGALEILLTTPIGEDVYLRGRMLALKRSSLWPVLFVLLADVVLLVAGCWQTGAWNWEWIAWMAAFFVLGCKLFVDLYAISWVGFWQGLKVRETARAVRRTVFFLFVWRWIALLAFFAFLGLITRGIVFQSSIGGPLAAASYVVSLVMSTLYFFGVATSELHDNLRALALPFDAENESIGWLRRLFSRSLALVIGHETPASQHRLRLPTR